MRKFMYFAAALLVLVGCNKKDNSIENTPKEVVTIKGSIQLPKTPNKIAAPDGWESANNQFTMLWEAEDQIYIYNEGDEANRQDFILATGENSDYGTFAGSTLPDMSAYKVAYGYDPSLDYNGEATYPTYTVPYVEGNYRPFAEGTGVNYDFAINNFGPVIGLQLKGTDALTKIVVVLLNSSKATLAKYTMEFGESPLTLNTTTATKVYFPIQAKDDATEVAIRFYKEGTPNDVLIVTKRTKNMPEVSQITTYPELEVKEASFVPTAVDLGLSVEWATCNVGATAPEGYGDYYAWGETEPYYTGLNADGTAQGWKTGKQYGYRWQSYCNNQTQMLFNMTEWNPAPYNTSKVLKPEKDVANVKWSGTWRMPTKEEIDELYANCNFVWTNDYEGTGIAGCIVTPKTPNDNSIFLPATGGYQGVELESAGKCSYFWSSTLAQKYITNNEGACSFYADMTGDGFACSPSEDLRYFGHPVRPVRPKN